MKYNRKYIQTITLDITGNFEILLFEKARISCILLMLLRIAFVYVRRVFLTHNSEVAISNYITGKSFFVVSSHFLSFLFFVALVTSF